MKRDARKEKQAVQQALRERIVELRKQGKKNEDIAEYLGVSQAHASTIWQRYRRGGQEAVHQRKRGRRYGQKRTLNPDQEQEIQDIVMDKTPDEIGLPYALWTRGAIQELIRRKFGIGMPVRTVGLYLRRWGFTPQKPIKRAREQSQKEVDQWLCREYPKIAACAKKEKAEIIWADETGIQVGGNLERGYARSGKQPVVHLSAKRVHISMISAITNGGKVRFMMYKGAMNSGTLITFMARLIRDTYRKIYLIVDNLPAHHSSMVTDWVEKHKERIAIFHLPSYAPDLNPDEYLNGNLKKKIYSGKRAHTESELKRKAASFMKMLGRRPDHVKSFFHHPSVVYAA